MFLRQQYFDQGLTLIFHKVDSHISQVNLVDGNKANNTPYSLLFVRSEYFFLLVLSFRSIWLKYLPSFSESSQFLNVVFALLNRIDDYGTKNASIADKSAA